MNQIEQSQVLSAFVRLGSFLAAYSQADKDACVQLVGKQAYQWFGGQEQQAIRENGWFTQADIRHSLASIAIGMLAEDKLSSWLAAYPNVYRQQPLQVGVIAAGNIPLVCFHDFLCVLASGNNLVLKPSSKDSVLVRSVVKLLLTFEPALESRIVLADAIHPSSISRLIATGSNNTARYVAYAYQGVQRIVRKNRTSVAVLGGSETAGQLAKLCDDIFLYAGMGCRSVAKLYVPRGYSFDSLLAVAEKWGRTLTNHALYRQCYLYERANALLSDDAIVDGRFFILKQSTNLSSPLAVVNVEYYERVEDVSAQLLMLSDQLQCVVGDSGIGTVRLGDTQAPSLSDYADGVDTVRWLSSDL